MIIINKIRDFIPNRITIIRIIQACYKYKTLMKIILIIRKSKKVLNKLKIILILIIKLLIQTNNNNNKIL